MASEIEALAKVHCRRIFTEELNIHDEKCLNLVESVCHLRQYRKKECIIQIDDVPSELPFIVSGSAYGYFTDDTGRNITDCVAAEYGDPLTTATSLDAFFEPTDIRLDALEPTTVVSIPVKTIIEVCTTYPEAAQAMTTLVSKWFTRHRQIALWRTYALPARYENFCKLYPALVKRLTKTAIAACLSVDISSISRLVK